VKAVGRMTNMEEKPDRGGRLSKQDLVQLSEQIASLAQADLPLSSGLRATSEELPAGRLRRVVRSVSESIERGASLDAAIVEQGSRLPAYFQGLARAGTRTGNLGPIMGRFVGYAGVGDEIQRKLWLSLASPFIALMLSILIFLFVCVAVVKPFNSIYRDYGVALSSLTIVMNDVAEVVSRLWEVIVISLALCVGGWLLSGLVLSASWRRSLARRIPLLGAVWKWTSLAEFCHLLGLLLESEVPLVEAVSLAGAGVADADIRSASRWIARDVESGLPLSSALANRSLFPQGLAAIVRWAEEHRSLPEALRMLGELCESRAQTQASFATTVIGVVAVFLILGVIVLVVGATLVPMLLLLNRLSG
jgi:general secretion pathway protein F